ncbi:MAG TPA: hypothetical protein VN133_07725 [Humibacter sp.]|jgi:hypothetical protein|nr:hypothetical protein [Humibacter sp.]
MSLLAAITAQAEPAGGLIAEPWVFGLVALCVFASLAFVVWTYRDVANRHSHRAAPDAADHAAAPGATHHGDGHPGRGH